MNTIRKSTATCVLACVSMLCAGGMSAQTFNTDMSYNIGQTVPDNNQSGLALTENFSSANIGQITDLTVTLDISGGFNGDFYAYLEHDGEISVLLNRVGRTSANTIGYGDSGMNVTFDDASPNNIHQYQLTTIPATGSPLTGTWAPDGRNVDPATVTTSDPSTANLSAFNGVDPNGQWTLFVADLDSGGVGTVESFGLDVTGTAAPDQASTNALLLVAGAGLLGFRRFARLKTAV